MSAHPSDIDNAIVARLGGDAALLALCPNGVYFGEAPERGTRFVIVSIVLAQDEAVFGGRALIDVIYSIEARMRNTPPGGDTYAAAARIDTLLEDQPLTVAGYTWIATYREEVIRFPEVDAIDPSIRWQHRGGHYRVQMALAAPGNRVQRDHRGNNQQGETRVDR